MDDLFKYQKEAIVSGLCEEYKVKWRVAKNDKEALVRLAMVQQSLPHVLTFAYQGKGVSKKYVMREFADYINGKYEGVDVDGVEGNYRTGLYVGYEETMFPSLDVVCTMWCNIPTLEIPRCKAMKLYIGCASKVNLVCEGYNSVTVMLFDKSKVVLEDVDEDTSVSIYKYSDEATVEMGRYCLSEKIRIFNKEIRL